MSKKEPLHSITDFEQLHTTGASYDLLRYVSLPKLLGEESHTILYFMGKTLAQTISINSMDDIIASFKTFGWGTLEVIKEKNKYVTFHLLDDSIVHRLRSPFDIDFRYESGFLAEACERIYGVNCECTEKIHRKIYQVEFTIIFT